MAFSEKYGRQSGPPKRIWSESFPEYKVELLSRCIFLMKIIDLEQIFDSTQLRFKTQPAPAPSIRLSSITASLVSPPSQPVSAPSQPAPSIRLSSISRLLYYIILYTGSNGFIVFLMFSPMVKHISIKWFQWFHVVPSD